MKSWVPPPAEIVDVRNESDTTFVSLRLDHELAPPLAPSTLLMEDGTTVSLDAVVGRSGPIAEFRTTDSVSATVGARGRLQQWWTPDAYDAVRDAGRTWVCASPSGHEHCLLDWTEIGSGGARLGWRSNADWICDECYDEYIVGDRLGLRS